ADWNDTTMIRCEERLPRSDPPRRAGAAMTKGNAESSPRRGATKGSGGTVTISVLFAPVRNRDVPHEELGWTGI
ncbi:MAG: hypothetical protein SGI97_01125, partial [candidate division Zixibacteria bacterium]|nr:hypothetical protein [candidate division Zixibacteria bacterium]